MYCDVSTKLYFCHIFRTFLTSSLVFYISDAICLNSLPFLLFLFWATCHRFCYVSNSSACSYNAIPDTVWNFEIIIGFTSNFKRIWHAFFNQIHDIKHSTGIFSSFFLVNTYFILCYFHSFYIRFVYLFLLSFRMNYSNLQLHSSF